MDNRIYTGGQIKAIDHLATTEYGLVSLELLKKAGECAFFNIRKRYAQATSMLVLCGSGNNGGDGYVIAQRAVCMGWKVHVISVIPPKTQAAIDVYNDYKSAGGLFISVDDYLHRDIQSDITVDALFGIGLSSAPTDHYAGVITRANHLATHMVSIDVPSGIDADTGQVYNPHINADLTISFIAAKIGLMTGPALNSIGEMIIEDLGIPVQIKDHIPHVASRVTKPHLLTRKRDSNKSNYGHLVVAGGENGMLGAVLLAGQAALRSGSGKVHILSTRLHQDYSAIYCAELMSEVFEQNQHNPPQVLLASDVIALGPGLGLNEWGHQLFDSALSVNKLLVVDADALTMLAQCSPVIKRNNWILTPHPGEAARLLGLTVAQIQSDRMAAVKKISQIYGGVCILKGAGTLIATHRGQVKLCEHGNPGMATAGMGDILTGIIASLLGQGYDLFSAAQTAVWLHATTADRIVKAIDPSSLIASDIVMHLPVSLAHLDHRKSDRE